MKLSWMKKTKSYKSPWRVVLRFLFRSRETQLDHKRRAQEQCRQLKKQLQQQSQQMGNLQQETSRLKWQVQVLKCELAEVAKKPLTLPLDPPLKGHGYGPRLISLAVNMAQLVGLRSSSRVLESFLSGSESNSRLPISPR